MNELASEFCRRRQIGTFYADEFTVDTKNHDHISWAWRLEKALIKTDKGWIALNIVVAFSRLLMYGIMVNKNANDSL